MKSLFIKSMMYSMFVLLFASCKKDETKTVAGNGTAPVLTATQSSMVLLADNAADTVTVFNWTTSSFGYSGGVSYTLQMDKAGNDFIKPQEIAFASALTTPFTVASLNSAANKLGLASGVEGEVEVRIKASISDAFTPAYSNVIILKVTPYFVAIDYPSLWVPGSYQNWAPATAAKISSVEDNGAYEGYINFPDATTEFKINPEPDWDASYGTSSEGTLNATGGDNLKVTGAGYYLLKADTKALTYSLTKTTWAIIGEATGSASAETALTYDATDAVWTITKQLSAGAFKFRANGSDAINFGDNAAVDGKLQYGGTAISVTEAGTYKITLNLSIPGNYAYTLAKQ